VAEALALGHRPGKVVRLDEPELDRLLEGAGPTATDPRIVDDLLGKVRDYREEEIETLLRDEAARLGARAFLDRLVVPLVEAVGRRWADGELGIRHEHFLSSVLEDRLRAIRLDLGEPPDGPVVLLATLPGELHGLGLHMAALTTLLAGARPRILGVDSPVPEIVAAAAECGADAVGLSISLATGGPATDRVLAELRDALPGGTRLIVGGRGARGVRRGPRGVEYVADLAELEAALRDAA
jgi:methanogenic corrinoid protein MtbC1